MIKNCHTVSYCFINAPFAQLQGGLIDLFTENRLQPEIGLEGGVLSTCREADFIKIAGRLRKEKLACTLHAPFLSLDPASGDPERRRLAWQNIRRAFALLDIFEPRSIVCHPYMTGWEGEGYTEDRLQRSVSFWTEFIDLAAAGGVEVMFENTYEKSPAGHLAFFTALNSSSARFCLDVGHVMAFAGNDWTDWLPALEPWLGQLHLHDNNGANDQHLGLGTGLFDFEALFDYLDKKKLQPLITLEPHTREGLDKSLQYLTGSPAFQALIAPKRKDHD